MTDAFLQDERLADLMIQRSMEGLGPDELSELERRASAFSDYDDDAIDRIAAALTLRAIEIQPMPAQLRKRLDAHAAAWLSGWSSDASGTVTDMPPTGADPSSVNIRRSVPWTGWLAAASLLVAALGWWRVAALTTERGMLQTRLAQTSSNLSDARAELEVSLAQLAAAAGREGAAEPGPEAMTLAFAPAAEPDTSGARGQLVWDNGRQAGYMRFAGLAVNDPRDSQYQLWIFDATRGEQHPVDGGVFDIPAGGGEVTVPIRAKLTVGRPTLFAVTIERPGGVVVSGRERVVVLARPDQEI